MLFGNDETEIMATAIQPPLRNPAYSDSAYRRIFEDFFVGREFSGTTILELGPGQYDFARLLATAGAKIVAIDRDPAVIALGRRRGHTVHHGDLRGFEWSSLTEPVDGLFCRGSINAFWYREPEPLREFIDNICSCLKPDGWGWVAPWNAKPATPTAAHIKQMLLAQRQGFERYGFSAYEPTPEVASRYNISVTENTIVFFKNIDPGRHLEEL